jgi:hypothetical protein
MAKAAVAAAAINSSGNEKEVYLVRPVHDLLYVWHAAEFTKPLCSKKSFQINY